MVKLSTSKGTSGESAARIFGSEEMGLLFSQFQAAVIRSGFELERMIYTAIPEGLQTTLDALTGGQTDLTNQPPLQVVFKPSRPDPENPKKSIEADLLIVDNIQRRFMLVEVKEGHVFDTKKADGELASLKNITSWLAQEFAYKTHYYLCSFNQEERDSIVSGTKKRFTLDHVLTGRDLCEIIGIDYDALRTERRIDQAENRRYFLSKLLAIPTIRDEIIELLRNSEASDE
jgi:hypothetical protein